MADRMAALRHWRSILGRLQRLCVPKTSFGLCGSGVFVDDAAGLVVTIDMACGLMAYGFW
jgi:hypothetical protein